MRAASAIRGLVDVGMLTIRPDEFEAVLRRFPHGETYRGEVRRYSYSRVEVCDDELGVAVMRASEQGQGEAQAAAGSMLRELRPRWLMLVGIAGGIPDYGYSLGDVVLATRLHDFSVSAASQDRPREFNVAGGPMHPEVQAMLAHLPADKGRLKGWNTQRSVGRKMPPVEIPEDLSAKTYYGPDHWKSDVRDSLRRSFPENARRQRQPRLHVGPIAASDTLVKDADLARQWQQAARHTAAVEMELGGVYRAVHEYDHGSVRLLAIRGLSDIVGFRRHEDWTAYACHSAASCAAALIRGGFIEPREEEIESNERFSARVTVETSEPTVKFRVEGGPVEIVVVRPKDAD